MLSGKMSPRTALRWQKFPFLAKRLFSYLDLLCVQNEEHASRFSPFVRDAQKIQITGNLKFDMRPEEVKIFPYLEKRPYITISSTHAPEEDLLLDKLAFGPWTILLAPRHPERFEEVANLLLKKKIRFVPLSELRGDLGDAKVVLIDSMGLLATCYARSLLAIVGGSFVPGIGGHNVLEPCLYGCPSLFGPYTSGQKEIVQKVLNAKAGMQLSLDEVLSGVQEILNNREVFSAKALQLVGELRGISVATWEQIHSIFK